MFYWKGLLLKTFNNIKHYFSECILGRKRNLHFVSTLHWRRNSFASVYHPFPTKGRYNESINCVKLVVNNDDFIS